MLPVGIWGLILPDNTVKDWKPNKAEVLEVIRVNAISGITIKIMAVKIVSITFFADFMVLA